MVIKKEEQWRDTYALVRELSGKRLKKWWGTYIQVREFYEGHQTYEDAPKELPKWPAWSSGIRTSMTKQNLDSERIAALREINFPFEGLGKSPQPGKGKIISRAIALHKKFKAHAEFPNKNLPLSASETSEHKNLLKKMKTRAQDGTLSPISQKQLDLED